RFVWVQGVTHRLSTAYHPQTSGQVEVTNRGLKRILERMVGENRASWSDKLEDALWAFRAAFKTSIGCTPYRLVYGKACHLLLELEHKAYWALKHANFNLKTAGDHRKLKLNELNELHKLDDALWAFRTAFKTPTGCTPYNLIFSRKLKTRRSGPFTITKVFPYGTVELSQPDGPNFKVNGHRVKHYFGGDIPQMVVPDLQTSPWTNKCGDRVKLMNFSEPSYLFDFEEIMSIPHNNQGPPPAGPPPQNNNCPPSVVRPNGPAPDLRSMEELCQPSINGRGGPIASIPIQAMDFGLRHHKIQQVQNSCQFHGLSGDDANRHIDKFLEVTQHIKNSIQSFNDMLRKFLSKYFPPSMMTKLRNEITNFRQDPNESLFEAWERYKFSTDLCLNHNMLLVTQIDTFYNGLTLRHRDTINAAAGGTFMKRRPKECYDLIKNMTAHHNHWDTLATRDKTSRTISSTTSIESPEVVRQLEMMNKNFQDMMKQIQSVKSMNQKCETCGGPHSFTECLAVDGYTQEAGYATMGNHNSRGNSYQSQGSLPSDTIPNSMGEIKAITTRSGIVLDGPLVLHHPPFSSPKEVDDIC
nr:reverse transcriptase domain-containing protein [Tanacetum cinerariifolium]